MNYLHVGFPKCASSFLEEHYFSEENGFHNLLRHGSDSWTEFIQHELLASSSITYNRLIPQLPKAELAGKNVGVSYSDFVIAEVDYSVVLARWQELFPDSKVLIIIRSQDELLYSWYVQQVRAGYFRSINEFTRQVIWNKQQSLIGRMYFDKVVSLTKQYFSHVKVIPFELIRTDFDEFKAELDRFFGRETHTGNIDQNPSPPNDLTLEIMRVLNKLWRHGLGQSMFSIQPHYVVGPGRAVVNKIELPPQNHRRTHIRIWSHRVGKRLGRKKLARKSYCDENADWFAKNFGESNRKLERMTGLDLKKFNYPGVSASSRIRSSALSSIL